MVAYIQLISFPLHKKAGKEAAVKQQEQLILIAIILLHPLSCSYSLSF
jgi:hypothetical protein